jgi:hypothetical protein
MLPSFPLYFLYFVQNVSFYLKRFSELFEQLWNLLISNTAIVYCLEGYLLHGAESLLRI